MDDESRDNVTVGPIDDASRSDDAAVGRGLPPVAVYVVEDHDHVRSILVDYINAAGGFQVVGAHGTAREAVAEIVRLRPRIAVVDGRLGHSSGLDVCRDLRVSAPEVSCLIVTSAVALTWGPSEAAQAGALAFVVKQLRDFDLVDVLVRIANGERPIDDARPLGGEAPSTIQELDAAIAMAQN